MAAALVFLPRCPYVQVARPGSGRRALHSFTITGGSVLGLLPTRDAPLQAGLFRVLTWMLASPLKGGSVCAGALQDREPLKPIGNAGIFAL